MPQQPYDGRNFGRARCEPGKFTRHRHTFGYICVILSGRFVEAGDAGRFVAEPGDVLMHSPHEAHLDFIEQAGADVLNLPLTDDLPTAGRIRVADVDAIARLAQRDPSAAARAVGADYRIVEGESDWPDLLAADLRRFPRISMGEWASRHGLAPATVSRGFRQVYGTTPARYRAEARTRRALQAIAATERPFAELALDLGFADQAHMTRSVSEITGLPPGKWRGQGQLASRPV